MKSKVLVAGLILLLALFGYRMLSRKSAPMDTPVVTPSIPLSISETTSPAKSADESKPRALIVEQAVATTEDESGVSDISKIREPGQLTPGATVIEAKPPKGAETRASIVSLVADDKKAGPEREQLENVAQSFAGGAYAVQVFGDQLNAINGTYTGEIEREGKDPCSFSMITDGEYLPPEGSREADFRGSFHVNYECTNGTTSRFRFDTFDKTVKVIGDESKALIYRDGGGNYFQISFSSDFQRVTGFVYDSSVGENPVLVGKLSAQR
ncbi:MAG: hypothetical protein EOP04_10490 [Proteobacteria bacterium]|nr:MAG: hypothetical protein EOP04_10490 [Pseudomonadota bacterium]